MIRPLGVRLDIGQGEPRRLELPVRVKPSLIEVMRRLGIGALPKNQDGLGLHPWTEVHNAHKRVARHAEMLLLSLLRACIEIKHYSQGSWTARYRQALPRIAKRFFS